MAVMVPVTALVMWFSTAVVRLLYQGGQFDEAATIVDTNGAIRRIIGVRRQCRSVAFSL